MRYIVIGAGAIGGAIAARLAQQAARDGSAGHPTVLVARGENARAIRQRGLLLRTPDETSLVPIELAERAADVRLSADDVLVLATKTQQADAAIREWVDAPVFDGPSAGERPAGTAGEVLPIFTALNGVESERIASRYFRRVFATTVWLPSVHLEPGEVAIRIGPVSGTFIVGRYGEPTGIDPSSLRDDGIVRHEDPAADERLLATIQRDWQAAGFRIVLAARPMEWKYAKLLSNLGNALQALLGTTEDYGSLLRRITAEGEAVLRAAEIDWTNPSDQTRERGGDFVIRPVEGLPADAGGSSWQSLARGTGNIESDYLNGEIVQIARSHGKDAPLNATIQRLARQAAAAGASVGSMTVDELEHELERKLAAE